VKQLYQTTSVQKAHTINQIVAQNTTSIIANSDLTKVRKYQNLYIAVSNPTKAHDINTKQ